MAVFFFLLFVPIIIQHVSIKGHYVEDQKKNNRALLFFFVLLTVLVMLRHESIGNDTRNYIRIFNYCARLNWTELSERSVEVGFSFFNKIVSLFSENAQFFLIVVALVTNMLIYSIYRNLCVDASLTIVLFCTMPTFVMMFSGIRQMIAVGIGCIAYEFTRKKKIVPFILIVVLATTFHASAFMLAFMYPIYHAKITKKWLWAVIPSMTVVFAFNKPIFTFLTFVLEQYTEYEGEITSTGAYTMLILFVAFAVFSYLIPDESQLDDEIIGLRNFLLFSVLVQMFAPLHTLAMRMNYYYIIFIPLLLPKIIECRSERWNQIAVIGRHVMTIFFLVYFFYNASGDGNLNVFPYHFFWETA